MKVLIVGAGPTGLVLALWLARRGVKARIIDKANGPGETSRAMAVQARTLEFYDQLGFADQIVEKGIKMHHIHLYDHGKQYAEFNLSDYGEGVSPYPYALSFPQDDHERFLVDRLAEAGVTVEWETSLTNLDDQSNCVVAKIGTDCEEFDYVCGCDGAHSVVREQLNVGFPGGTYDVLFFVADVVAQGRISEDGFQANFSKNHFVLVFPIRSSGHFRLIGMVPPEHVNDANLTFETIQAGIEESADIKISEVNWFSRYKVHHRVAEHFRIGRTFLLGDAGHIHSPVGGQGMNTGLGDAVNLAWKLAEVANGADPKLLDSYEMERIAFARKLVETTDRVFGPLSNEGVEGFLARNVIAEHLLPFFMGFSGVRHAMFRMLSQTRIDYRDSPLSDGKAGDVHGGDRLPWAGSNFQPLRSMEWQLHVYGSVEGKVEDVPMRVFPYDEAAEKAGLAKNGVYLVRPDGYVAIAGESLDVQKIKTLLKSARGERTETGVYAI